MPKICSDGNICHRHIPAQIQYQGGKQKLLDSLDVILSLLPFAPSPPADLSWGSKSDNHLEERGTRMAGEGDGEGKRHDILKIWCGLAEIQLREFPFMTYAKFSSFFDPLTPCLHFPATFLTGTPLLPLLFQDPPQVRTS